MSCADCAKELHARSAARRTAWDHLSAAAASHGYELWFQEPTTGPLRVLAIPAAPNVGTPDDVAVTMSEGYLGDMRLTAGVAQRRSELARLLRSRRPAERNPPGRRVIRITHRNRLEIELHFLEKKP